MRVADYIPKFLSEKGIKHVFLVTGGGAMFLNDGIAQCKEMTPVCMHHEQAAAMAAVGYAKRLYTPAFAMFTTGCGGTNAMTGLLNAYQDNIPCIFVSGQVKRKEASALKNVPLRQLGVQEADIVSIVKPITKYAVVVDNPSDIQYEMQKAWEIATSGRPGPVWIDIPMDVQGSLIDEKTLRSYTKPEKTKKKYAFEQITARLNNAKRPMVIAGQGIKLSNCRNEFLAFLKKFNVPYVASRLGIDILPSDTPYFIGRIGTKGDRAGNFAVQNADYVLALGSRLSVSSTGQEYSLFAREAVIDVIDIDEFEHQKNTIKIDHFICADLRDFFADMQNINSDAGHEQRQQWLQKCLEWKDKWKVCLPEYEDDSKGINLYKFVDELSNKLKGSATVVSDAGSAFYVVSQAMRFAKNQGYVTSGAQAEMGFSLPAAVGVAFAAEKDEKIVAITGDGSLQMNIQELQTLVYLQIPVKLFVWNNDGYLSIRATQKKFFENSVGTDSSNGVSFPDLQKLCGAYGLKYIAMKKISEMDSQFDEIFDYDGPVVCELFSQRDQAIIPAVSALRKEDGTLVSKPLEDMFPFLSREEFLENMIVKPMEE